VSELAQVEAEQHGILSVVRIRGEVDISNAADVSAAIQAVVLNTTFGVVIDLTGTTYLDSSGVAVLVRLAELLGPRRQQVSLVVPPESPIRTVLDLTGLPKAMPVHARLDEVGGAAPEVATGSD